MSARRVGGGPAATADATVTNSTANVTKLTGSASATRDTRVSSATSPVNLGGTAVGVRRGECVWGEEKDLHLCVPLFYMSHLLSLVVATVKTTRFALTLMAPVLPVSPAGPVHSATARVRLVITATVARRSVHVAETMNPVTQKLAGAGGVTLDGLDPGVHTCWMHMCEDV